jgi:prepilin-type N-terminal cleavage/methylation domain-containing protein
MRTYNNHNGFTLIELSVVLVIIGILVGMGASMMGPLTNFVKVRETKDLQDASIQSIISWASSRNRLPTKDEFSTVAKNNKDAWYQEFLYLYDASLIASTSKDNICGRRSTSLKLDPGTGTPLNDIAFVIISRADNRENLKFKSTYSGTLISGSGTVNTVPYLNFEVSAAGITPSGSLNGTIISSGTNPDILRWVTLDELRSKIGCQGAPLKILNNELPPGYSTTGYSYNATILADGGVSSTYGWCVKTATAPTPPANLAFNGTKSDNASLFKSNCDENNPVSVASWYQAGQLVLTDTPSPSNSHFFTVFVSDSSGSVASKSFVLTVNP